MLYSRLPLSKFIPSFTSSLPLQSSLLLIPLRYNFSSSLQTTKQLLSKSLYSIQLINKSVGRRLLSMAYSPGVGAICQAIKSNPSIADLTTLRSRSIAIVSDGSMLNTTGQHFLPIMDWFIAQIKYYSGLDAFPFVIDKDTNLPQALKDLAVGYGTVLYLDDKIINQIPTNLLFLKQQDIVTLLNCELTDAQKTASVLSYLINNNIKGIPSQQSLKAGLTYTTNNFKTFQPYPKQLRDGRDIYTHSMDLHLFFKGKIHIELNFYDINLLKPYFTQALLRQLIKQDNVHSKTRHLSAIVTDGTAVLGYGNIGPAAGLPVMQGKSLLFKLLGDVQVVPVCIHPRKTIAEEIKAIINLCGNFDAINLQDIKAPQCFDIESGLNNLKILPIFHDDQHGTAIVTLAGLINASKVVQKQLQSCKVVINGAGAAGITIAKLLLAYGIRNIIVCDSTGAIYRGRTQNMNSTKLQLAQQTNLQNKQGSLADVIKCSDIFIGVSIAGALHGHMISSMNKKSIVFALANPIPQILPHQAKLSGAFVYGSGRSDFENQINNSLVFPGIFRSIMRHRIKEITKEMKIKAAEAIAASIQGPPTKQYIIPDSLDKDVAIRICNQLGKINLKKKGNSDQL